MSSSNLQRSKTFIEEPLKNKNTIWFVVAVLCFEILALPIFGVLYDLRTTAYRTFFDDGGILLISILTILLIIGFGLINTYVMTSSISGMVYTLVIFVLTIQQFYLFRAFWNKAGTNDIVNSAKTWDGGYRIVTMSNYETDRQQSTLLPSAAFVEGIGAAISLSVAFNPLVGRIGLLQIFFLTLFGTFFYEVNAELMWRWFVTDTGFGNRILIFGSVVGLVTTLMLDKKDTTINHPDFRSSYRHMSLSLLGFLFVWCTVPFLSAAGVYSQTTTDNAILYATPLNFWLSLFASVLGVFTGSSFMYRKFSLHDLVFTGTAGAFAFSSSPDVNFNPCAPLIVGYVVALATSLFTSEMGRWANKKGVIYTNIHIQNFLIPGVISSIVSGIIQACGGTDNGAHVNNYLTSRTFIQQGGWQILGMVVCVGIALLAGFIIGLIYKGINKYRREDQFNDYVVFSNIPETYD